MNRDGASELILSGSRKLLFKHGPVSGVPNSLHCNFSWNLWLANFHQIVCGNKFIMKLPSPDLTLTDLSKSSLLNHTLRPVFLNQSTMELVEQGLTSATLNQSDPVLKGKGSIDALLYIIIVLSFYAFSIVVLMIKYIRREKEEANLREYYHEYVSRDKFHSPRFQNRLKMNEMLRNNNLSLNLSPQRPKGTDLEGSEHPEAERLLNRRETPV